jgi:hypothetical protein
MNCTSPTTAVSTVVGSSHSTGTFRCTHWAQFRGPSHPAALVQALVLGSPLADASALVTGMDQCYHRSCLVALGDAGRRNRVVSLLRLAVNSARPSLVAA